MQEPVAYERDGQVRDVDPDPAALEALGSGDGRPTTTEWVEHGIAFVTAGRQDAFKESFRFLGRVAKSFCGS